MKCPFQWQNYPLNLKSALIHVLIFICIFSIQAVAAENEQKTLDLTKLPSASTILTDFARDIQPLFADKCVKCHGPEKQKGGLRLDSKAAAFKGGDEGKVIVPGKSSESRLVHLVAGLEKDVIMPPKGERLTTQEVSLLRAWIDQGANWPESAMRPQNTHWSLQPLQAPVVPNSINHVSPVDVFVAARLATKGMALSPPADRATLIRRLSFDLIGLPPSPHQIDEFTQNKSQKAYEELVERLLASPRYGERWGRHWLDVARYTESQGFEYDKLRDNAWHYRDYVIKSFNDDKPYDRFMKEQVAGDVLEPVTTEGIIGASLLVCGAWDEAGNSQANATQKAITREEEMEDMISVVGQTFLGLTLNCARCHSHKFDPIPQEEYYRIKAVFDGVKHGERPIASASEIKKHEEEVAVVKKEIAAAEGRITQLEREGWKRAAVKQHPGATEPGPIPFAHWAFNGTTNAVMPGEIQGGAAIENGRLKLAKPGEYFRTRPLTRDIREKTLEVWVTLAGLSQGAAVIAIENEDGSAFDSLRFGERQDKKWGTGSNNFDRTRNLDAPEETSGPGVLIHMAVVYRTDNSITLYRNGEPYGKPYTPGSPLQTFKSGSARVLLGTRHTGGDKTFLIGEIKQAALHHRALSAEEVGVLFRAGGIVIPESESLENLTETERTERERALAQVKQLRKDLEAIKPLPVSYTGTRVQPAPTHKLKRGDVKSPEDVMTPAGLSAILEVDPEFGLKADAPEAERRLKFAEWLANTRNPLPARVMVNRVWHLHFGQGLVSTPNDFGVSGARPTHPELLDWLAVKFIASGWSVKALHRLIVNSATYQQSSQANARAMGIDGDNTLLWRFPPHRLEAETVRDAVLAVSGQLNPAMGGPSFRPFDALKFPANAYVPVDKIGPEFNRRTIYRMNVNSGKEPLLDSFDCPDPSVKTPRRGVTTTPLQALALMNNSFLQRHAGHLAERALKESEKDLPRAIQTTYRLTLGRRPTEDESKRALAAARDRSLTNVCWALLNSTEFIYVR
jgi:mono/diheme cytochrome c family protein